MSRQARNRRRRRGGRGTRLLVIGLTAMLAALVIAVVAAVGYVVHVADEARPVASLHSLLSYGPSQVIASDGTRLGFISSDILRSPVAWEQIPANLSNATVAIEDQRFYKHHGVD